MNKICIANNLITAGMTAIEEQEALSRRYGNSIIIILRLSSGRWAIFNSARELCGLLTNLSDLDSPASPWRPPKAVYGPALALDVDPDQIGI